MHCSVTQNGELSFLVNSKKQFYLKDETPMQMKRSNTRFSAQPEIRQYATLKSYLQSRNTAVTLILKRKQTLY